MSDLNIAAGEFYKLVDGQKAKVCEIVGDAAMGYIIAGSSGMPEAWFLNGRHYRLGGYLDIVAPWTGEPVVCWEKYPPHIVAVAEDQDGVQYGFTTVNVKSELCFGYGFEWRPIGPMQPKIELSKRFEHCGNWKTSLAIRPGCALP